MTTIEAPGTHDGIIFSILIFSKRLSQSFAVGQNSLQRADAHEIVEMHNTDDLPALDDQEGRDLVADALERLGHQRVRADRARPSGHHALDRGFEREVRLQVAPQVAVGDDADQPLAVFERRDAAKALRGHFDDGVGHSGIDVDSRDALAGMHDLAHMREPGPELAAGVEGAEVAGGEAAALEQRDRQRVAEHELERCRGRRRETVRTGLLDVRQNEADVGFAPEGALAVGGDRDQRDGEALGEGDHGSELDRLARPGDGEQDVAVLHHAQIAVARLGRMDEGGRLAGRGEGRGDLPADVPGLAHAGDHDAAARRGDPLDRTGKSCAEPVFARRPDRLLERLKAEALVLDGPYRRQDSAG